MDHRKQNKYPNLRRLSKRGIYERNQAHKLKNREKHKLRYQPYCEEPDLRSVCHCCSCVSDERLVRLPPGFTQHMICTGCYDDIRQMYKRD